MRTCCLAFFLMLLVPSAGGQNGETAAGETQAPRPFDRPNWQRAIRGLNYTPPKPRERKPERSRLESQPEENAPEKKSRPGLLSLPAWSVLVLRSLGILAGVGILLLLLRGLLGLEWTGRAAHREEADTLALQLEKIEENPGAFDLQGLIGRAEAEGQYALAVRLHYLAALNALSLRGLIRWKKNKTNGDYLRELRQGPWHFSFNGLTLAFEEIWYGQQPIEAWRYQELSGLFQDFAEQVNAEAGARPGYASET